MTKAKFDHVRLSGVVTVVPPREIRLDDESQFYTDNPAKLTRLKKVVGLETRRAADECTTPADLCECAARKLLCGMDVSACSIDALICVLDYPDYRCPPTACVLHGKLGMPQNCLAFDVTHGCAGYLYGLYVASSLLESGNCKRVLLLVGDTKTRTIDVRDRIAAPIFGDGAAATLLEYSPAMQPSFFTLGCDGSLHKKIIVPAGGARVPHSPETAIAREDGFGNIRSPENFYMDGKSVFDFTMRIVPQCLTETMQYSGCTPDDIDYAVLHQANRSIIKTVAAMAGIPQEKTPAETLAKYGNLAVASVPSVLNDRLSEVLSSSKNRLLLSGFGVGLSWGGAVLETNCIFSPDVITYQKGSGDN